MERHIGRELTSAALRPGHFPTSARQRPAARSCLCTFPLRSLAEYLAPADSPERDPAFLLAGGRNSFGEDSVHGPRSLLPIPGAGI